eukprot:m.34461 g.34461  ORF g.34461 m.34461 type:complete len:99 (-) comp9767_c0_seq4:462-758(-)
MRSYLSTLFPTCHSPFHNHSHTNHSHLLFTVLLRSSCVKEVAEERISAAMVAKLSTELIKSEYSPYSSCPPRRKIKKMSSGLVFDTSSRGRSLPSTPL